MEMVMKNKKMGISGKVAFLSGATGYLGQEIAEGLACEGAIIYLNGRDEKKLKKLSDTLNKKGYRSYIAPFDFSDEKGEFFVKMNESANFLWEKIKKKVGKLDVHWKPMDENDGLVNYVCKIKFEGEEKLFKFSDYWRIHEGVIAA